MRLDGFPWAQFGSVEARVTRVASEIRDNLVRVEFEPLSGNARSPVALQHGLPGSIEVTVEQTTRRCWCCARPAASRETRPATGELRLRSSGREHVCERDRGAPRQALAGPEVVQTSAMDCGPASLKCLLEGFRIPVSYGRLREACQTDVDGTSIDTMEVVASQLGLDAEQVMIPVDHLFLSEAAALPASSSCDTADGATHFVVAWRRTGAGCR